MGTTDRVQVRIQGVPYEEGQAGLLGPNIELQARVWDPATNTPVTDWQPLPAKHLKLECAADGFAEITVTVRVHSMVDVEAALTGVRLDLIKASDLAKERQ